MALKHARSLLHENATGGMAPKRADLGCDLELRQQLAELKGIPLEQVGRVRMTPEKLPSLVDVGVILTGKTSSNVARDLQVIFEKHNELTQKVSQIKFGGRGNRESPVPKDLPALIEIIFLLPGRAAAQVRQAAAQLFVRFLGGDLSLIAEVERFNHVQSFLRENAPEHPARAFGEAVESCVNECGIAPLTVIPAPEGLVPSSNQRDAYVMRVVDESVGSLFWKIGRSDDPLARAVQLDYQVRREGVGWRHEVDTIFRHGGVMESLLHRKFQDSRVENTKEYFRGSADFSSKVAQAMVELLPMQLELQFQDRRKSETRGGPDDDPAFKRRRIELELARDELSLKRDQAQFDSDARVASAKAEADVRVASAKADADVRVASAKADADAREISANAEANAIVILAKAEAEAIRIRRGSVQPSVVISAQPFASAVADQPTARKDLTGIWDTSGGAHFLQAFQTAKHGRRLYPMKATDLYLRGVRLGDDALGFLQKNPLAFQMARSMMQAEARSLVRAAKGP